MLGTLQSCAVSWDVVSGSWPDQRQGGHTIGVDIMAIVVPHPVGQVGMAIGPSSAAPSTGNTAITDDTSVDAHAVTIIVSVAVPRDSTEQGARTADEFRFQGW